MKIVILDGKTCSPDGSAWKDLRPFGEVIAYERTAPDEVLDRVGDAEIVCTNKVKLSAELLAQCPNLRLICVLATGYNVVDTAAARARSIDVCNIPAYSTASVAQMTTALLLELTNHVALHSDSVHRGDWAACPDFCYWLTPLTELDGKTMGIIGYGKIGQAFGKVAQALGMRLLVCAHHRRPELESDTCRYASLDEVLSESYVVSLHCPQTPETEKLINRETISKMRPGALLLNTSRGGVLDEAAVAEALRSGHLGGAAVDVVSSEPISPDNPLLTAPNCIITPHISWAGEEPRARLLEILKGNIQAFLAGSPRNVVN